MKFIFFFVGNDFSLYIKWETLQGIIESICDITLKLFFIQKFYSYVFDNND